MSGVLLDTNAALWLVDDSPRLGPLSHSLINTQEVWVSSASLWEVAIKQATGKLRLDGDFKDALTRAGVRELTITWAHPSKLGEVQLPRRDPFDRMLVAQAKAEGLLFLTADRSILGSALPFTRNARD